MGFKIKSIFNYLIDFDLPAGNVTSHMEATTVESSKIRECSLEVISKKSKQSNVGEDDCSAPKENSASSIPDPVATTLQGLLNKSKVDKEEIDFLIVASKYPDFRHPYTAGVIQDTMELPISTFSINIHSGSDVFLKATELASSLLDGVRYKRGVVIFSDELYSITKSSNETLNEPYVDISSAMLLEYSTRSGIKGVNYWNEGHRALYHIMDENGDLDDTKSYYMSGEDIQKYISTASDGHIEDTLKQANVTINDISLFFINSQNNAYVSKALVAKGVPVEKIMYHNAENSLLAKFYPILIEHTLSHNAVKHGDKIFISSFGKGLTYGNMIIEL